MTADKPSHLVPKLRFAEFVDEPPWKCTPLKKLATRITRRNTHGAKLRVLTNSAERGVVDQREYFEKDIATNTDNYYIVERGDYVYNPRISSAAPVGPISKNQIGTGVMSPLYTVFRFRSDANDFFAHYFRSSHWHGYLRRVSCWRSASSACSGVMA
jgi:type I restriction enzyme, S subunit